MEPAGIGVSLEGVHAVSAALAAGRVISLTVERGRIDKPPVAAIVAAAEEAGVPMQVVDDVRPEAGTSAPQGIIARARPLPVLDLADLLTLADPPAIVVLDRVEDPRNLGAVARSAVAAGLPGLVVARRRAAPLNAAAFKAAAGAFESLGIAVVGSVAAAVGELQKQGLWAVGLGATGERPLFGLDLLAEPVAVVIGAEGAGLSRLVRQRVDVMARIPMLGPMESLNVAAAATLAVYEVARVRAG